MHTSHTSIVRIANLLAVYRWFRGFGIHSLSVVVLRTLAVINTKWVMVLLLKLLKTFLNSFEILVCRPNIHGYESQL